MHLEQNLIPSFAPAQDAFGEKNKWTGLVMMSDAEVFDLDFFRGYEYQHFFKWMDSTNGFSQYGWGDHVFRTVAVVSLTTQAKVMPSGSIPYAHQSHCFCPEGSRCTVIGHFLWKCKKLSSQERARMESSTMDKALLNSHHFAEELGDTSQGKVGLDEFQRGGGALEMNYHQVT